MIKGIIVDDEPAGVLNVKALLKKYCPHILVVGEGYGGAEALELINRTKPDLVFLDIEMPLTNGFELLDSVGHLRFEIIFITAFEKYALKAFKVDACDYILKPIDINDLVAAVTKATERIESRVEAHNLKNCLIAQVPHRDKKIALPSLQGMVFVKLNDVIRCEADGCYTWFYFADTTKMLVTKKLGDYEVLFKDWGFIRVHHASLINCQHIVEFKKGNSPQIVMIDNSTVSVSQRKKDVLLAYIHSLEGSNHQA